MLLRSNIDSGSVHIWTACLKADPVVLHMAMSLLSGEEIQRADHFYFPDDRRRFILCRALLRSLLGSYSSVPPRKLRFTMGAHGKPAIDSSCVASPCHFNVSHSHDRTVIAIARGSPVGVDVERLRSMPEARRIARYFFSPFEQAIYERLPASLQPQAFFSCWTRKEAFTKALGAGLSIPFRSFAVSLGSDERPRLLTASGEDASASGWTLFHLEPAPGHLGALAALACIERVNMRALDPQAVLRSALAG